MKSSHSELIDESEWRLTIRAGSYLCTASGLIRAVLYGVLKLFSLGDRDGYYRDPVPILVRFSLSGGQGNVLGSL